MANDTVWQKSQRFGDIASVISGLVMIILALFVPGMWNILLMTVIIIIWMILCIVASHRYYLEQNKKDNT